MPISPYQDPFLMWLAWHEESWNDGYDSPRLAERLRITLRGDGEFYSKLVIQDTVLESYRLHPVEPCYGLMAWSDGWHVHLRGTSTDDDLTSKSLKVILVQSLSAEVKDYFDLLERFGWSGSIEAVKPEPPVDSSVFRALRLFGQLCKIEGISENVRISYGGDKTWRLTSTVAPNLKVAFQKSDNEFSAELDLDHFEQIFAFLETR